MNKPRTRKSNKKPRIPLSNDKLVDRFFDKYKTIKRSQKIVILINMFGYKRLKSTVMYMKTYGKERYENSINSTNLETAFKADKHFRNSAKAWIENAEIFIDHKLLNFIIRKAHSLGDYNNIVHLDIFEQKKFSNVEKAIKSAMGNCNISGNKIDSIKMNVWNYHDKFTFGGLRMLFSSMHKPLQIEFLKESFPEDSKNINDVFIKNFKASLPFLNDFRNAINHTEQIYKMKRFRFPEEVIQAAKNKDYNTHEMCLLTLKYFFPKSTQKIINSFIRDQTKNSKYKMINKKIEIINIWGEQC